MRFIQFPDGTKYTTAQEIYNYVKNTAHPDPFYHDKYGNVHVGTRCSQVIETLAKHEDSRMFFNLNSSDVLDVQIACANRPHRWFFTELLDSNFLSSAYRNQRRFQLYSLNAVYAILCYFSMDVPRETLCTFPAYPWRFSCPGNPRPFRKR